MYLKARRVFANTSAIFRQHATLITDQLISQPLNKNLKQGQYKKISKQKYSRNVFEIGYEPAGQKGQKEMTEGATALDRITREQIEEKEEEELIILVKRIHLI